LPYCRICGAKLEEDARFCHKCGTPVATFAPAAQAKPIRRSPFIIPVIILIVIVFTAAIVSAVVLAPLQPVNFNQTNQVYQPNITTLDLNFQADTAQVNVVAQSLAGKTILIGTSAVGTTGILGSSNPIQVTFSNETVGDTLRVTSKVTNQGIFGNVLSVACNIYVDPTLNLNLNITTETGQISLTANQPATIKSLNLKSATGLVQANIQNGSAIAGGISLRTTTGAIGLRINQANVEGNNTFNLQTTTGTVDMNIAQNKTLSGNVQVNAATTTGTVNLSMLINNGVGARIESQTQIGPIQTDLNNFSGKKSPIESNNYPAESNFLITLKTSFGAININASYQSATAPSTRN
jgi:hypothetical protein